MKNIARCILFVLSIGILNANSYADGKFFYREGIPADIPYQRAFLIFHENSETLILQSKYEVSDSQSIDSLGWVVPIPSVPEISSFSADIAQRFFSTASRYTQPKIIHIWDLLRLILSILFICSFIISILLLVLIYPKLNKICTISDKFMKTAKISFYTFLICLFILIFPSGIFSTAGMRQSSGGDVEILKAEKAGIYDVKVIKSGNTEAILEWLNENNFDFDVNDSDVFTDYISRDWCFVVAKVQPEPGTKKDKISREGLAAPLVLKFDTEKAIYPTALTASIGTDTQILLYTLSDNKLDCKDRLKLRTARKTYPLRLDPNFWIPKENQEYRVNFLADIFKKLPQDMIICKFKDTLTSDQMKTDIFLENAPDNQPYHETKIVW